MLGARALTQAIADACRDEGPAIVVAEATQAQTSADIMRSGMVRSGSNVSNAGVAVEADDDDDDEQMVDSDEVEEEDEEEPERTLMVPSLFAHRRGTVWFDYAKCIGERRTLDQQLLFPFQPEQMGDGCDFSLVYKQENNINCISQTLKRQGFKLAEKGQLFNIHWGGYLSDSQLSKMVRCQHTNHYPGSFCLGRKDALWAAVSSQMRMFGEHYAFVAKTYILPRDRKLLKHDFEELGKHAVFIIKPPNSACGIGIKLVTKYEDVPRKKRLVVQRYIGKPFLIKKKKFDLRLYVVVTSFDPLRVYLYDDGLVRFATHDYCEVRPGHKKHKGDRFMHLTNYSINKSSDEFVQPSKAGATNAQGQAGGDGSKWTVKQLWSYMREHHKEVDVDKLISEINDVCVKTLIAAEPTLVSRCNHSRMPRGSGFEVYGFDVLFDHKCKPWLLEVNVFPSLSSTSPLDKLIKTSLMTDVFHMVGIVPFDRKRVNKERDREGGSLHRLPEDRDRKWHFTSRSVIDLEKMSLEEILDTDDLEVVMEAEDELRRCGHLERIFPCPRVDYYAQFFPCKRYMNTLLWKWVKHPNWNLLLPFLRNPNTVPSLPNTQQTIKSKVVKNLLSHTKHKVVAKQHEMKNPPIEFHTPSTQHSAPFNESRHPQRVMDNIHSQTTRVAAAKEAKDAINDDKMHKLEKLERKLERLTRPATPPIDKAHPSQVPLQKGGSVAKPQKSSKVSLQQRHEASLQGGKGAKRVPSRSGSRQEGLSNILRQNTRLSASDKQQQATSSKQQQAQQQAARVPQYYQASASEPARNPGGAKSDSSNALLSSHNGPPAASPERLRKTRTMTDLFSHNNNDAYHLDTRTQDNSLLIENLMSEEPVPGSSKPAAGASKSAPAGSHLLLPAAVVASKPAQSNSSNLVNLTKLGETPGAVSSEYSERPAADKAQHLEPPSGADSGAASVVLHQGSQSRRKSHSAQGSQNLVKPVVTFGRSSPAVSPSSASSTTKHLLGKQATQMHVDTRVTRDTMRRDSEPVQSLGKPPAAPKSPVAKSAPGEPASPLADDGKGGKRDQLVLWRELLPSDEKLSACMNQADRSIAQHLQGTSIVSTQHLLSSQSESSKLPKSPPVPCEINFRAASEAKPLSPSMMAERNKDDAKVSHRDDAPPYGLAAYMSINNGVNNYTGSKTRAALDSEVEEIIGDQQDSPSSRPLLKPGKHSSGKNARKRSAINRSATPESANKNTISHRNQISMLDAVSPLSQVATVSMSWQPEVSKADRRLGGRTIAMGLAPDSRGSSNTHSGKEQTRSSSDMLTRRIVKPDAASGRMSAQNSRLHQQFHLDRPDIYNSSSPAPLAELKSPKSTSNRSHSLSSQLDDTDGDNGVPWLSPKLFQTPEQPGAAQPLVSQFKGVETVIAPPPPMLVMPRDARDALTGVEETVTSKSNKSERSTIAVATATAHFSSSNTAASSKNGAVRGAPIRGGQLRNASTNSAAWASLPERQVLPPAGVSRRPTGFMMHQAAGERRGSDQLPTAQSTQGIHGSRRSTSQAFC